MEYIPTSMEKPTDADEVIGAQPSICKVSEDRCERELPRSKSPVEISCARTSYHDGVKAFSFRLPEKGTGTDVNQGHDHWPN